jgi:GTP cyclohydrolase I
MDRQMTQLLTVGHYADNLDAGPDEVYDPEFEVLVHQMLVRVGEDPEREGLKGVPKHKIFQECGIMAAIRLGR